MPPALNILVVSPDPPGELDVLWHDGDSLGVDSAQVGVLEQVDQERFASLLRLQFAMEFKFNIKTLLSMTFNIPVEHREQLS